MFVALGARTSNIYDERMSLKFWRNPLQLACVFLMALYATAIFFRNEEGFLFNEAMRILAVTMGFGLPHVLGFMSWKNKPQVANLLTTMLILLLLADPQTSWIRMAILGLITALIKTVVRLEHQPLINPAAAGLFASSYFGVLTTWWGVSFAPRLPILNMSIATLLTIPIGFYLVRLYKKVPTLIGIPVSLMIVYFLQTGRLPLITVFEGTFAFFLLIMATEPKTTPLVDWQEWIYAILLGSLLAFLFVNRLVGEPYLAALLTMNFIFGIFKFIQLKLLIRQK